MTSPCYTAAQIAVALGSSRPAVRRTLARIATQGSQLVRGNETATWSVTSLPPEMLAKLNRRAKAKGFRNADHLLRMPAKRYESPIPVSQLAQPVVQQARKLRGALSAALIERSNGSNGAAFDEAGVREYERIMGYRISAKHWRNLMNRTIDRDAGEEHWDRLDLYLDARAHRASAPTSGDDLAGQRDAEKLLLGYAFQVRDLSAPTSEEKALLWSVSFEQAIALVEEGMPLRAARIVMRQTLWRSGVAMAKNEITLAQLWRQKELAWRAGDGNVAAIKDARSHASGNFRTPEIPQSDLDQVIAYAVKFNGRVSQAWRHVLDHRLLSADVLAHFESYRHASKSYVPRTIRVAVTHEVRLMRDIHHGPRTAELNGAYITRSWKDVAAGDWYQSDDVTLNVYYYVRNRHGEVSLMRGQVLLMIDVRSTCILGFAILDQRNYTAHAIRSLITSVCDEHGLPRKGFYFERGIWEKSKLLKGSRNVSDDELSWGESEGGLRDLGLKFVHSKLPRSKPVERVIGQIQDLMEGQPGDAGRNEMKDKFERFQEHKRLVESGQEPVNKYFFSEDEWTSRLTAFCEEYNEARNDGQMTGGSTPARAWKQFQADPLVRLPAEARYLLAHHKRPCTIGLNGISLRFGKETFRYRNAETGKRRGQRVLAWFNPGLPELLAVTDMNRENCFTIERSYDVPAMDAPEELLHREKASAAEHNGYARQRYIVLKRIANLTGRRTLMDSDTAALGRDIESQKTAAQGKMIDRARHTKVGAGSLSKLGMKLRRGEEITPQRAADADELAAILKGNNS
jgi:hypothetical protein